MLDEALRKVKVADHMLTMTYPLVKDPKILLAILDNIQQSMDLSIKAALTKARSEKKISPYPDNTEGRIATYQQLLAKTHKTPAELIRAYQEIRETLREHETSPVEFRRKESFVICDETYKVRTLTEETLKKYLRAAKELQKHISLVIA